MIAPCNNTQKSSSINAAASYAAAAVEMCLVTVLFVAVVAVEEVDEPVTVVGFSSAQVSVQPALHLYSIRRHHLHSHLHRLAHRGTKCTACSVQ